MSLEKKIAFIKYKQKLKVENEKKKEIEKINKLKLKVENEKKKEIEKINKLEKLLFDHISENLVSFLKDIRNKPQKYVKRILNEVEKDKDNLRLFRVCLYGHLVWSLFAPRTTLCFDYSSQIDKREIDAKQIFSNVIDSLQKEINKTLSMLDHSSLKIQAIVEKWCTISIVISW